MGDANESKHLRHEEIIAAFDREHAEARQWSRRHADQLRDSYTSDRPVYIERRRRPRQPSGR